MTIKASAVPDFKECYFYHTLNVPGHGVINGQWDLRDNIAAHGTKYAFCTVVAERTQPQEDCGLD
jgi:hypothetical protein